MRDAADRDELIRSVLPLARSIASRYAGAVGEPWRDDLIAESFLAVVLAASRYDPACGAWPTYAYDCVRHHLGNVLPRWRSPVLLPQRAAGQIGTQHRAAADLRAELGREPTRDEIEEATGRAWIERPTKADPMLAFRAGEAVEVDPVDELIGHEPDPEGAAVAGATVETALGRLPARERFVLRSRYGLTGDEATLAEIGGELHVSRERVRQVERVALKRLRLSFALALARLRLGARSRACA